MRPALPGADRSGLTVDSTPPTPPGHGAPRRAGHAARRRQRPRRGRKSLADQRLAPGWACKEHSRIEYLKRGAEYDAHICAFLDHHPPPGWATWRLVLGGDLFDFLQVTNRARRRRRGGRRCRLGTREEESAWKLARLMERHRSVFVFLAGFIGAGHRVEVVQGNHDEELFWPRVRDAPRAGAGGSVLRRRGRRRRRSEAFASRIHFNAWFYTTSPGCSMGSWPPLRRVLHHAAPALPPRPQAEDSCRCP
ncbi:MAG: hypothetical protein R3F43_27290 [bacterium]